MADTRGNQNILTPAVLLTAKITDDLGGRLYTTNCGNRHGFDVEMDHFAILLPDKIGYVYQIQTEKEKTSFKQIVGFDFICSTGSGPCIVICVHAENAKKIYQAIAHVSSLHSLNEVMDQILERFLYHCKELVGVHVDFYLFGGTESSLLDFLSIDEQILAPENCYADDEPRIINKVEDDNISVFLLENKILIFTYDGNFKNIKNLEQSFDPEKMPIVYNPATNPKNYFFVPVINVNTENKDETTSKEKATESTTVHIEDGGGGNDKDEIQVSEEKTMIKRKYGLENSSLPNTETEQNSSKKNEKSSNKL